MGNAQLNDYIIRNANSGQSNLDGLAKLLSGCELFFNLIGDSNKLSHSQIKKHPKVPIRIELADFNGESFGLFYVSKSDKRLNEGFAGMQSSMALQMLNETSGLAGVILQSDTDAWIGVNKEGIGKIIEQIKSIAELMGSD